MVSIRFLSTSLFLGQALLAQAWNQWEGPEQVVTTIVTRTKTTCPFEAGSSVLQLNPLDTALWARPTGCTSESSAAAPAATTSSFKLNPMKKAKRSEIISIINSLTGSSSTPLPTITTTSTTTIYDATVTQTGGTVTATAGTTTLTTTSSTSTSTSSTSLTTSSTSTTSTSSTSTTSTSTSSTTSETTSSTSTSTSSTTLTTTSSSTTSSTSSSTTPMTTSSTTTTTTTTTTSSTSSTSTSACPTDVYTFLASDTGDGSVDGNYAQLQQAFGSGYRTIFNANAGSARGFKLSGPTCNTLVTADNGLQAMVGGTANLHSVYFFPSVAAASALINVQWELLTCMINADNTLTCTAMGQSIFQVYNGQQFLYIGDQNYGRTVTINLTPVPGTIFKA